MAGARPFVVSFCNKQMNDRDKLKECRRRLQVTQGEMAERLGLKRAIYNHYESGRRRIPDRLWPVVDTLAGGGVFAPLGASREEFRTCALQLALAVLTEKETREQKAQAANLIRIANGI